MNPNPPTPNIDRELSEILKKGNVQMIYWDAMIPEIKQALKQSLVAEMPKKQKHEREARMDTDLEHGHHTGEVDGWNAYHDSVLLMINKILDGRM